MPSVGSLTIEIEAQPDKLSASQNGTVLAKFVNCSLMPLDAEFVSIKSSDTQVATVDGTKGNALHNIAVSARPSSLTAYSGHQKQETIADWHAVDSGNATLTAQFKVQNRFGTLLGILDPSDDVQVT